MDNFMIQSVLRIIIVHGMDAPAKTGASPKPQAAPQTPAPGSL